MLLGIYGNNQRPTTGIWAEKGFGGPMDAGGAGGAPAPDDGGVKEEDTVPVQEPSEPAEAIILKSHLYSEFRTVNICSELTFENLCQEAPASAPTEAPAQDFAQPAAEGSPAAAAAEEAPAVEEVEEPNGQVEEIEEQPAAAGEEPAAEEEKAPEPPEEECDDEEDCGGGPVVVNVAGGAAPPQAMPQPVAYPVPAVASQQLPMEWAAEDAAEHAYNLAQWRVKILRAKMEQVPKP